MMNMYLSERTSLERKKSGEAHFEGKQVVIGTLPSVFPENPTDFIKSRLKNEAVSDCR